MSVERAPERVVSLVPSTTESVFELGAGERLVGRTRYCTEPAGAVDGVTRVGGTKNPDRERLLALSPDLVLANAEENRVEDIEWLSARVPTLVQTPRDVPEAVVCLRQLADRLAVEPGRLQPMLLCIEAQLTVAQVAATRREPPRVYYAIWRKPWMTVGHGTYVHDVLTRFGATPIAQVGEGRYPELTPEHAVARGTDLVLLASEPWEFDEEQRAEIERSRIFGDAVVRLCDGRDFCWHGTRMAEGLARVAHAVH